MATPPNPQEYYFIFTADSILRIPRLPTEVLLLILTYVPPEDLCHVALASREWYDLAYDAGLQIRLSTRSADSDRLTYLRHIVFHALQHDRSPRIALHLNYRPRGEERTTGDMSLEDAVGSISYALPYLSVLSVDATCGFAIRLCAALTAPAPFLHSFTLTSVSRGREGLPDATLRLDPGLFARDAPRLRSVTLDVPLLELPAAPHTPQPVLFNCFSVAQKDFNKIAENALKAVPIDVFHAVTSARVSLGFSVRDVAADRLFPKVENLSLSTRASEDSRRPITVDISALALRRLTLDDPVGRAVTLTMNPELRPGFVQLDRVCSSPVEIHSALWPLGGAGALDAHIFGANSRMAIALRTADGAGSTSLRVPLRLASRNALDELDLLPLHRLNSLTVSESLLGELLQTQAPLPALRTLCVACTPGDYVPVLPGQPGQWTICVLGVPVAVCRLLCPALETVVFSADHRFPVRRAQVVTELGRLVALADRKTRPRLVVSGVTATNLACAMEYFSSVRTSA